MEDLSDLLTGTISPKARKHAQITQACDPCRLRKVRCQLSDPEGNLSAARLQSARINTTDDPPDIERQARTPCRRCRKHGIQCSFLLPVGRRGPKGPRNRRTDIPPDQDTRSFRSSSNIQRNESPSEPDIHTYPNDQGQDFLGSPAPDVDLSRAFTQQSPLAGVHNVISPVSSFHPESRRLPSINRSNTASLSHHSHASPYEAFLNVHYSTDDLYPRDLLLEIIDDYLQHLYPLLPVVHRPTFRANLERKRDTSDKGFLSLLLAICAFTVACLPRRFEEYQRVPFPIHCRSRLEMIDYCYGRCMQSRGPRYFDEISHTKWAIPCLFYVAYFHVGEHNKSRMIESEAILFARLLELHRISAYSGLNLIETQLRKKAFWLMFYSYVHLQLQDHRKERIAFIDCSMLHDLHLEDLLPAPCDDEQISETEYSAAQDATPTLTAGFNLRSRLFWTAIASRSTKAQPTNGIVHCHCTRLQHPELYMEHLHSRVRELKYMLDNAAWYLRQWGSKTNDNLNRNGNSTCTTDAIEEKVLTSQLATLRADIHVTHLWLQSIILDQIDSFSVTANAISPVSAPANPKSNWFAREDICHQMLLLLWSIPESSLEALGLYLVYKVRDVAGTLLTCPFSDVGQTEDIGPVTRAKEYLRAFTDKLRELDKSETINSLSLQTWVDTDRNEAGKYYYW